MEVIFLKINDLTFSCKIEKMPNCYSLKIIDNNLLRKLEGTSFIYSIWYNLWHRKNNYINEWQTIIQNLIRSGPFVPLVEFYFPNYQFKSEHYKYFEETDKIKNQMKSERIFKMDGFENNGIPQVRFIATVSDDSLLEYMLNNYFDDLNIKIYLPDLKYFDSKKFFKLTEEVSKARKDNIDEFLNVGIKYYLHSNFLGDQLFCFSASKENFNVLFAK
jgi:hypothetical protein